MAEAKRKTTRPAAKKPNSTEGKVRLLRIAVQPIFIVDDGTDVVGEMAGTGVVLTPKAWRDYPAGLKAEIAALQKAVDDGEDLPQVAPLPQAPVPVPGTPPRPPGR